MSEWAPGIELGPYVLLAPIGAGGMGEVWKARDARLNRMVAIKRLKTEHAERFKREARAIAALNHPHICQIYDVGVDYLVMEYVEGEPLKNPLPPDEAVRLAVQIAAALEAAHRKGIVHRDLKPGNILVGPGGVKLLDFGLAKMEDPRPGSDAFSTLTVGLTEAGAVVGTIAYMSPEQAQGQPVDARSDIFSFGLVLYEVLSGKRAFAGENAFSIMSAIVRDEPSPLQAPAALESVVTRCLRKAPLDRFQTMTEVHAALVVVGHARPSEQPSIAVLPFADMSPGKDNEYFSDGLAEEIINALAQVPDLKVIARTSAFAFKGQQTDIRRIAEALGVSSILEGSVRKAGNRIRVTAQLITAADGSHLWSQRYDRELEDVFAVQDEIAAAIAGALQVKLSHVSRRHTPLVAAYEAFLKGRHYWAKLTPESLARSRECYERAVSLDPQFALARNALAEHYFALSVNGLMPVSEAMPRVRQGALEVLEIDPSLSEPHALLGMVAGAYDRDWDEAARHFKLAMAREPVVPYVRWLNGELLVQMGRFREAAQAMDLALQEDPLHLLCRAGLAACLYAEGKYAEAFEQLRQVLEIDERNHYAYWYLSLMQAMQGMVTEALASSERAYSLAPWDDLIVGLRAGMLARTRDSSGAEALLGQLRSAAYGSSIGWAAYYLVQSETGQAVEWLAKAIEARDPRIYTLLHGLRSGPHWPRLAKMMNLPETAV